MKKSEKIEKAVPFRLSEPWLSALQDIKTTTAISKQQLLEDATAFYMGKRDPLIAARRRVVLEALADGRVERPFNAEHAFLNSVPA